MCVKNAAQLNSKRNGALMHATTGMDLGASCLVHKASFRGYT